MMPTQQQYKRWASTSNLRTGYTTCINWQTACVFDSTRWPLIHLFHSRTRTSVCQTNLTNVTQLNGMKENSCELALSINEHDRLIAPMHHSNRTELQQHILDFYFTAFHEMRNGCDSFPYFNLTLTLLTLKKNVDM